MNNTLIFSTLNCEGVKRSTDYIISYLYKSACDVIALQVTWLLDGNATYLSNFHNTYMYTEVSGVDCKARILTGRPYGGVAFIYKKSLRNRIVPIKSTNRRICGFVMKFNHLLSCLFVSMYLPCDNYSTYINSEYVQCIDDNEILINSIYCNAVVCYGDYNTSFEITNGQTECLNNFISRNKLCVSWNYPISKKNKLILIIL